VLAVEGEGEPLHDPAAAIARAEGRLPSVTAVRLPNASHLAGLEQPERVNELILEHLEHLEHLEQ
jgi:pimeloyl-ACP methyl ester carboxylesterase